MSCEAQPSASTAQVAAKSETRIVGLYAREAAEAMWAHRRYEAGPAAARERSISNSDDRAPRPDEALLGAAHREDHLAMEVRNPCGEGEQRVARPTEPRVVRLEEGGQPARRVLIEIEVR